MRAIESYGVVESDGRIRLLNPVLPVGHNIKVIILIQEDDTVDDDRWLHAATASGSFDFLNDPEEDIYSKEDGQPITNAV